VASSNYFNISRTSRRCLTPQASNIFVRRTLCRGGGGAARVNHVAAATRFVGALPHLIRQMSGSDKRLAQSGAGAEGQLYAGRPPRHGAIDRHGRSNGPATCPDRCRQAIGTRNTQASAQGEVATKQDHAHSQWPTTARASHDPGGRAILTTSPLCATLALSALCSPSPQRESQPR
jgi:hypothetical protein